MTSKKPFFVFNPKSYLYGDALLSLARVADEEAGKYPEIAVYMTAPYAELKTIADATSHIIVTAQHMDGIYPGRGMGFVLPESLYHVGVHATFLNHAEHALSISQLKLAIERCKELGIKSIVCADSIEEAKAIAHLEPDILLCEPTALIGTGQTSDQSYMRQTNQIVKAINPDIQVMQAAGISKPEDVYQTIQLGADGTGCTSGIVKAANPEKMLREMILSVVQALKKEEDTDENISRKSGINI